MAAGGRETPMDPLPSIGFTPECKPWHPLDLQVANVTRGPGERTGGGCGAGERGEAAGRLGAGRRHIRGCCSGLTPLPIPHHNLNLDITWHHSGRGQGRDSQSFLLPNVAFSRYHKNTCSTNWAAALESKGGWEEMDPLEYWQHELDGQGQRNKPYGISLFFATTVSKTN